jgi:hypothetical protein
MGHEHGIIVFRKAAEALPLYLSGRSGPQSSIGLLFF